MAYRVLVDERCMTKVQELVRNADGAIPDLVGFHPFDTVEIKTRYVDKAVYAHTFPLKQLLYLHESDFALRSIPNSPWMN